MTQGRSRGSTWALLLLAILAGSTFLWFADSAQAGKKPLRSYCSPTGDYCQSIFKRNGKFKAQLSTFSFRGKVQLCVKHRSNKRKFRVCKRFRLKNVGSGIYESKVNLTKRLRVRRKGRYAITWRNSGTRIGKTLRFRNN